MFEPLEGPLPTVSARVPQRDFATFGEGVSAGFTAEAIETDWWGRQERSADGIYGEIRSRLTEDERPDLDSLPPLLHQRVLAERAAVLKAAQLAAEKDPQRFGDLPLTEEAMREEVLRREREEHADAEETLGFVRGGGMAAEFLGRGGAAVSDPTSLAMLAIPGARETTLARVVLREAFLGMAGEAAVMPRRFRVAQELGIEDPNILFDLALGAAFGGALGSAPTALSRGAQYARERLGWVPEGRTARDIPEIDSAEEALQTSPERVGVPLGSRAPDPAVSDPPARVAAPERARELRDLVQKERDRTEAEVRATYTSPTKPLTTILKRAGIRIDPEGRAGQELRARGVTNRTVPGLFAKGGADELDNLDPDTLGVPLPRDETGNYIDRDGLLEAIEAEVNGGRAFDDDLFARLDDLDEQVSRLDRAAEAEPPTFEPVSADTPEARRAGIADIEESVATYARDAMVDDVQPEDIRAAARQIAERGGRADEVLDEVMARRNAWLPTDGEDFADGASSKGLDPIKSQADEDLRAALEEGDFEVTLSDGRKIRASELVSELDGDREFVEVAELCNAGSTGAPF